MRSAGRLAVLLILTLFTVIFAEIRLAQRPIAAPRPQGSRIGDTQRATEIGGSVDLLGNDVTEAVATYKLDATGSLYEEHSPQTELPRLGSPKS